MNTSTRAAARCAALANFNNLFFMRSRDTALDLLAANYLGERSTALVDRVSRMREEGDVAAREVMRYERETRGPAVPVGALSRLPVGEAYALIGGEVHAQPICLVPFYDPPG